MATAQVIGNVSIDPGLQAKPRAGSAGARAARKVARVMLRRGSADRMTRTVNRVLLIVPSLGPQGSAPAGVATLGTGVVVDALRAAGFQTEVYDAAGSVFTTESIGLQIEHSYPQVVVVAAQDATGRAASDILRTARETIPGVLTVVLGARPAQTAGEKDKLVDCVLSDDFERLPSLLTRLTSGRSILTMGGVDV